jgi:hypothetical protein
MMFVRTVTEPNHILHLLMTVLFCGLWLPVWIVCCFAEGGASDWRCTQCGKPWTGPQS